MFQQMLVLLHCTTFESAPVYTMKEGMVSGSQLRISGVAHKEKRTSHSQPANFCRSSNVLAGSMVSRGSCVTWIW